MTETDDGKIYINYNYQIINNWQEYFYLRSICLGIFKVIDVFLYNSMI